MAPQYCACTTSRQPATRLRCLPPWKKIDDQNMSRKYFGTDGIRGLVGEPPITPDFMVRLGYAAGEVLVRGAQLSPGLRPAVLIGKDTRISGYMLEASLEAGFAAAGVDVMLSGPMPTPAVAYLTRALRLQAGVVISASHNPYPDNGSQVLFRGRQQAAGRGGGRDRNAAGAADALPPLGAAGQGAAHRRRRRPLHRILQKHLSEPAGSARAEDRGRLRQRRGLSHRRRTCFTSLAPTWWR